MYSMRKKLMHVMTVFVLLCSVGCGSSPTNVEYQTSQPETLSIVEPEAPNAKIPTVMINGILFEQCWNIVTFDDNDVNIDGTITSSVSISQLPSIDDQSNLDFMLGAPYVMHEDGVAVFMDYQQEWSLFRPR